MAAGTLVGMVAFVQWPSVAAEELRPEVAVELPKRLVEAVQLRLSGRQE